jgi:aconitase B
VTGETNTDDLSPAPDAWSRPDIPLHALAMLKLELSELRTGKNWKKREEKGRKGTYCPLLTIINHY